MFSGHGYLQHSDLNVYLLIHSLQIMSPSFPTSGKLTWMAVHAGQVINELEFKKMDRRENPPVRATTHVYFPTLDPQEATLYVAYKPHGTIISLWLGQSALKHCHLHLMPSTSSSSSPRPQQSKSTKPTKCLQQSEKPPVINKQHITGATGFKMFFQENTHTIAETIANIVLNPPPLMMFSVCNSSLPIFAHFPSLQPPFSTLFVLIWVMWATPLLVIHFQLFLIVGWICQRGLTVQNEKGMFDNYSNLPAKSPFILYRDHLRHKCCQGNLPGSLSLHWKQKSGVLEFLCIGCFSAVLCMDKFLAWFPVILCRKIKQKWPQMSIAWQTVFPSFFPVGHKLLINSLLHVSIQHFSYKYVKKKTEI